MPTILKILMLKKKRKKGEVFQQAVISFAPHCIVLYCIMVLHCIVLCHLVSVLHNQLQSWFEPGSMLLSLLGESDLMSIMTWMRMNSMLGPSVICHACEKCLKIRN